MTVDHKLRVQVSSGTLTENNVESNVFTNSYQCGFPTDEEADKWQFLTALVDDYNKTCEEFDRKICTGPMVDGEIMPATPDERAAINKFAMKIFRECVEIAEEEGFTANDFKETLSLYRITKRD